jgi:acyl-CoA synthetase (AMP-forming)/AMP-acid ligase II
MLGTRMEYHWGRVMRCFAERPPTVDAMFRQTVARAAYAEAVVDDGIRIDYRELDARVDRVAAGLAARGVRTGDRVAVMLDNRVEAVIAVLAISRLGAVLVTIGTRLRRPEIAYIFGDAAPVAIIHESSLVGELPMEGPAADMRFSVGASDGGARFDDLAASGTLPSACPDEREEALFAILYTSGTTGRPKGAMLTHLGVIHSCLHWADRLALRHDESTALCIPWSHVAGLCGVMMPFLYIGGRQVMMAQFNRCAFLQLASAERITHALLVPAMYGLCLMEPDLSSRFDLSHWRIGVFGGAPMPEATMRRFAEAVPGLALCNGYGATETASPATIMPPGEGMAHTDSIGKVVACGDIRVMDDNGKEVPVGQNGELWIAGPMVSPGYWRNEAASTASFVGGFWKSGDIGSVDADGYVRIADRKKDMINCGGFKVYPAEVENVLCEIPVVIEAAVVGRHDNILGEVVVAFVNARPPASGEYETAALTEAAVRAFCATRMADYKVPLRVVVRSDPLPRNANGKIQKDQLRIRAAELPSKR